MGTEGLQEKISLTLLEVMNMVLKLFGNFLIGQKN
jgi:hypothetical protein